MNQRRPGTDPDPFASSQVLGTLGAEDRSRLVASCVERTYHKGQVVYLEGEPAESMFSLRSGQLKVSTFSPEGNELLLAIVRPGQIIGELGVLSTATRSATVTATMASNGWALSRSVVMDFLEQRPAMAVAMLQQLANMVRRTTGVAADLVFLDLSHRMVKLLLERAGDQQRIRATQAELASAIGASRQRVNVCLQEFQREGWISLSSGSIELLDPEALQRVLLS